MFIVLEGIDGSGKTTLSKAVAEYLPNAVYVSRKTLPDSNSFVTSQMKKVHDLMWTPNHGALDHLLPRDYWVFLQCTWYSMLQEFVIKPILESDKTVICDGWFYKFWARLEQQNYQYSYLETLFAHLIKPDKVILLNVPLDTIVERKKDFKQYEMGSHLDGEAGSFNKMISFQSNTYKNLSRYADEMNWNVVSLPTSNIENNTQKIISVINNWAE